jgi:hypothetical protein
VFLTADNIMVNMKCAELSGSVQKNGIEFKGSGFKYLFSLAGYHEANLTFYTFRKSGVKWGARCGAKDWQLKHTGRWNSCSRHFGNYIQAGILESNFFANTNGLDPIRKMWVYRPTTFLTLADPTI